MSQDTAGVQLRLAPLPKRQAAAAQPKQWEFSRLLGPRPPPQRRQRPANAGARPRPEAPPTGLAGPASLQGFSFFFFFLAPNLYWLFSQVVFEDRPGGARQECGGQ